MLVTSSPSESEIEMFYAKSTASFYDKEIHGDAIPADAVEITDEEHAALLAGQSAGLRIATDSEGCPVLVAPLPPTPEQIRAALSAAVQAHLDTRAQAAGYDSIFTAVTYADEAAVPRFQAEGEALRAWRSLVWAKCYEVLADVESGKRGIPLAEDLIAELPAIPMP